MIDPFTIQVATAIVVLTAGIVFILETLLRRDTGAGRIWSLAFLAGILTVLSYLMWMQLPDPWVAIGIGNGALVASAGCLWLGCRSYNGRTQRAGGIAVMIVSVAALAGVLVAGPDGGDWAGSYVLFAGVAVFAALGAFESRRGPMGATPTSIGFTLVLVVEALFYFGRGIVFAVSGPDSDVFTTWFGSNSTGALTMILTIVAVIIGSILRSGSLAARRESDPQSLAITPDGLIRETSFVRVLNGIAGRARLATELIGVIALRIDDLPQIGIAFGSAEEETVTAEWREGVRRYAPNFSIVGEYGRTTLLVGFQPSSVGDARRIASRIHRRLLDDFAGLRSAVIPVVGVGVALSDTTGYDPMALIERAQQAALTSASSSDASIMIAGGE